MPRFLLAVLAAGLLVLPATAEGQSTSRLRGTVALKNQANDLVTVRTKRQAVALRARGSMSLIRIGQRIELRGSTLRAQEHGSRVLARNVSIVSSQALASQASSSTPNGEDDDDEVEIMGKITSLSPLITVASSTRSVSCTLPAGMSSVGLAVGDLVEMTCNLVGGKWVVRELEHEDDEDEDSRDEDDEDEDEDDDEDDDEDEDDDHSGPGEGDDDDENDD